MAGPNKLALQLNSEIAAVITAMRQNAKWAMVPGKYSEEDHMDPEPHYEDFRSLRRKVFEWSAGDWSNVHPLEYLTPFLKLVREPEVSGPITGVALTALCRLLGNNVVGRSTRGAADAINAIVEDTTQCKFEATNPASDEVVLFNILQVLQAVVKCDGGVYLSDDSVCKAYQAAFMLGNLDVDTRSKSKEVSELLTHYSRQIIGEMTSEIFARLAQPQLPADAADVAAAEDAAGEQARTDAAVAEGPVAAAVTVAGTGPAAATAATAATAAAAQPRAEAPAAEDGSTGAAATPDGQQPSAAAAAGAEGTAAVAHADESTPEPSQAAEPAPAGGVSGVSVSGGVMGGSRYSHGLPSAREVLSFLIELIQRRAEDGVGPVEDDFTVFGLQMVHRAVLAGGSRLVHHPQILELLHKDLFAAMVAAVGRSPGLGTINGMCQVLLAMVQVLGDSSMVQVETMLENVLLRLADGKDGAGAEQQEAALEGLLDLCRCPGFLHAAFLSCDCRVDRANLFEDICSLVSKTAFPVAQKSLGPMHQISLEALLAVMAALSERLTRSSPQLQPSAALPYFVDVWSPICRGEEPAVPLTDTQRVTASSSGATSTSASTHTAAAPTAPGPAAAAANGFGPGSRSQSRGALSASVSGASLASASGAGVSAEAAARVAAFEKGLKLRCALAVEHFNKDYKKGFQFLQANKLLPELRKAAAPDTAASPDASVTSSSSTPDANGAAAAAVDEDELALCIGHFLRVAPGLNKTTIGELLGEPDQFYLKVLDAFTSTFQFSGLSFEAGIRMFLESFKLPGEAQKIDRIINCFGKHYYKQAPDVFRNEDAAYVLAYSVILLNTDRHNSQVKNKMTQDGFRRNNRGVNGGEDFPQEFLDSIYASICRAPLRMMRDGAAANAAAIGGVSPSTWAFLAQRARTSRGRTVALPPAERHCFDGFMFQVCWGPAVHAMGVVLEHAEVEATVRAALDGLKLACQIAAHFDIDGVADSAVLSLSKYSGALSPAVAKPRVVFGRDPKAPAATEALFYIITRYGDCIRSGWAPVMDLVLRLYQIDALPPALEDLLDADAHPSPSTSTQQPAAAAASTSDTASAAGSADGSAAGSSVQLDKAAAAGSASGTDGSPGRGAVAGGASARRRKRRAALGSSGSARALGVGGSFLRSVTQLMALQEPEYEAKVATQAEREYEALALEVLHSKCAIQDVFADSRFLRPEALEALIAAIISAPGPLPRPGGADKLTSNSGANALGAPGTVDWESVELCLDLLMVVLLRNRDRLALLWPAVFDHLTAIIRGKAVDAGVVQSAATGVLRLCQRLLPYKPEAAEPLLRGLQLVPSLDPEVAWSNAEAIATEMLALVKTAAPHIRVQWAWASVCNLLKMTSVRPEAYPISLEALSWVVSECITPLNFVLALEAAVWFVERAALEHPAQKAEVLALMDTMAAWLEGWCDSLQAAGLTAEQAATFATAKSEFWLYLVEMLARLAEHPDPQLRAAAVSTLQRAAIGAERMGVLPPTIERAMRERLLPPTEALTKKVGRSKDTPQADLTVRELIRAQTKLVLLFAPQLQQLQGFSALWQAILSALQAAHISGSEALSEAVPEALKNMLLVLHAKGTLQPGWCDAHGVDLWALTWKSASRISSNLTPQMLMLTPTRGSSSSGSSPSVAPGGIPQSQQQQQQQQQPSQQQPVAGGAAEASLGQQQQLPAIEVAAAAATVGT